MVKEQPSSFWNAEKFYFQIISSTFPYIFILRKNWPWQLRQKNVENRKSHFLGQNSKIGKIKWWEIIILAYKLSFHNTDCTSIPNLCL